MNAIPIIRVEVETIKQAMLHAFSEQMLNLDQQFKVALDDACQPAKVQAILTEAANRYIKEAVQDETKHYFLYGEGRKHIAAKVKERMDAEMA